MGWVARLFIGIGASLAFLLVFGAVLAFTTYDQAKPYIEREFPTVLYSEDRVCDPCNDITAIQVFNVTHGMNKVRADLTFVLQAFGGSAQLTVTDPSGDVRYERTFTGSTSGQTVTDTATWPGEEGEWRLTRSYVLLRATAAIDVYGIGLPPGTL